jgi:DNA-binding transcriptional MerR regulator
MRQLDLFGSFFETPEEDVPGKKPAVVKKEEADFNRPAYSKNSLRSEKLASSQSQTTDPEVEEGKNDEIGSELTLSNDHSAVPIVSLFYDTTTKADDYPAEENAFEVEEFDLSAEILEEVNIVEEQVFIEEQRELNAANAIEVIISDDLEKTKVEVEAALVEPAAIIEPLKVEAKAASIAKPKKPALPELQRNGDIIFDDGKITVKIKNKSPFPPPIAKEKKEKKEKVKKPAQKRGRKSFKEIDAEVDLIEIPEDEILFQKQYYAISEVAKWFRVNTSLLRFWENEFDVLKPRKNRKGDRLFRPEDVKNLQLIYQLLRQRKYTIYGAKEYIKTNKKKADIQLQLTHTLQKFRSFLLDLKANLQP